MKAKKYDVIIFGGGTSGCSCAWNCAKLGLNTLLVEKNTVLGGAMTSGLVVPMMYTGKSQINTDFYENLISKMRNFNSQINFQNNSGWLNPETLKIVLEDMLTSLNVDIIYGTSAEKIKTNDKKIVSVKLHAESLNNSLSVSNDKIHSNKISSYKEEILSGYIEAVLFVDATSNGNFSRMINCQFLDKNNETQPVSLRFLAGEVDTKALGKWLMQLDNDRNTTPVELIDGVTHLSAAYTWDTDKHWALGPLFDNAVKNGDLKASDTNYFQIFTVAGMPDTVAFNCPRIISNVDTDSVLDCSKALIEGRQAIMRIFNFCKKYFKGFKNAYISNISDDLGIRVSHRVKGKYVYTVDDIINGKKFDNPAVISNYPVDVHSVTKDKSKLIYNGEYQLPLESLMSADYENLYIAGKCLSADFMAQGALRVQKSCMSMGEAVAKDIAKRLKS